MTSISHQRSANVAEEYAFRLFYLAPIRGVTPSPRTCHDGFCDRQEYALSLISPQEESYGSSRLPLHFSGSKLLLPVASGGLCPLWVHQFRTNSDTGHKRRYRHTNNCSGAPDRDCLP